MACQTFNCICGKVIGQYDPDCYCNTPIPHGSTKYIKAHSKQQTPVELEKILLSIIFSTVRYALVFFCKLFSRYIAQYISISEIFLFLFHFLHFSVNILMILGCLMILFVSTVTDIINAAR